MSLSFDNASLLARSLQSGPLTLHTVPPAPCTQACPAGINVKAYVSLIAEERFSEALEVVRESCPLPGICGRICHHPCEAACLRADLDEPVAIRALKRFIADVELDIAEPPVATLPDRAERVAVIGAGPAGLTAAYDLAKAGFPVTIFESEPEAGGMLRYGIADYRLPTDVLEHEIEIICRAGIEIRTECRIGRELALTELLDDGFSAVLIAVGAQLGRRLDLAEEERPEIRDALAFLRQVNRGDRYPITGRVVVVGGGSTAVEAARTALRLGAGSVEIVYRRHWKEMPASAEEVETAEREGVGLRYLKAPVRAVIADGELRGIECLDVALGEPDDSGRRQPVVIPGTESTIEADLVLLAVGQEADLSFLPEDVRGRLASRSRLTADPATLAAGLHGVFAAGDVVTGPATVIDAIAAGHRAAESIERFLSIGSCDPELESGAPQPLPEFGLPDAPPAPAERLHPPVGQPIVGREFAETEMAFSQEVAVAEAQRCLRCGPCSECRICAASCGRRHIWLRLPGEGAAPPTLQLIRAPSQTALALESGAVGACREVDGEWLPDVELIPARARVVEELCRGCARCAEVCGFEAISFLDPEKPESKVRIEPARCRGCNLCLAACPTDAVVPDLPSPRPADLPQLLTDGGPARTEPGPVVVVACRQRAAELGPRLERAAGELVPLWLRCGGEVGAGTLLDLCERGARRIVIASCATDHCRYGRGTRMATEQAARAQTILRHLGADPERIVTDWSTGGAPS